MSIFYIRTVQRGPAAARQQGGGRVLRGGAQQLLCGRHQVPRRLLPPQEAGHLRGALATPRVRAIFIVTILYLLFKYPPPNKCDIINYD